MLSLSQPSPDGQLVRILRNFARILHDILNALDVLISSEDELTERQLNFVNVGENSEEVGVEKNVTQQRHSGRYSIQYSKDFIHLGLVWRTRRYGWRCPGVTSRANAAEASRE